MAMTMAGSKVILLAKYDHAAQYETHQGATSGDSRALYGGRDKNYAEVVAMVISNDPPRPPSAGSDFGGFKVVQSDVHQVVYGTDADGLCMAAITGHKYPSRVAIQMLVEMHQQFHEKFGVQIRSATKDSLSAKSKAIFSSLCTKYDDPTKVDKASALLEKVDEVKSQMQSNIATMLANQEKAEGIAEVSDQLNEQAQVFKKKSTDLKKQMRCKNIKMTIIVASLVIGILLIILVPLIVKAKNAVAGGN